MSDFGILSMISPALTAGFVLFFGTNVNTYDSPATPVAQPVVIEESVPVAQFMTTDEYVSTLKDAPIEGAKSAKITLIEYSDLECPYCIMQFKNRTIAQLQSQYGTKINHIFRPARFVQHPGSDKKAIAVLCAASVWGVKKYTKFYQAILARSSMDGTVFGLDKLSGLAKTFAIDQARFDDCYAHNSTWDLYESYTQEARYFKIDGSPTTLVINNETKQYELVQGATNIAEFKKVIDRLIK